MIFVSELTGSVLTFACVYLEDDVFRTYHPQQSENFNMRFHSIAFDSMRSLAEQKFHCFMHEIPQLVSG